MVALDGERAFRGHHRGGPPQKRLPQRVSIVEALQQAVLELFAGKATRLCMHAATIESARPSSPVEQYDTARPHLALNWQGPAERRADRLAATFVVAA